MDREIVLAVLVLLVGGPATLSLAWLPASERADPTMRAWTIERRCRQRLWLPFLPTAVVLAALAGWAAIEPKNAEPVPLPLFIAATPFAGIWGRALLRALRSAMPPRETSLAITVGLLRPRAVFADGLVSRLDEGALDAARRHEEAHVRHRDPLRIWLAQFATDLQWPFPSAVRRFRAYLYALELARDEEVREDGVDGADLAAAILAAARVRAQIAGGAGLTGDGAGLRQRVERLLTPLPPVAGAAGCLADPLRIWLAQLATDLQWPTHRAAQRLRIWRHALALARDEEVRTRGVDGADLAAAILAAAQLQLAKSTSASTALSGEGVGLRCRIRRLLRPLLAAPASASSWAARVLVATALAVAVSLGWLHGEAMVRLLLAVGT